MPQVTLLRSREGLVRPIRNAQRPIAQVVEGGYYPVWGCSKGGAFLEGTSYHERAAFMDLVF